MADQAASSKDGGAGRWIVDQRGKRVKMLDPIRLQLQNRDGVIERAALDRILNDLERGLARSLTWKWLLFCVAIGLTVAAAAFTLLWIFGDSNFRAALYRVVTRSLWIYVPLVVGVFVVPFIVAKRRHGRRVLGVLLKHKRCPHCGYSLQGLAREEPDGATVCPECACGWSLEPHSAQN